MRSPASSHAGARAALVGGPGCDLQGVDPRNCKQLLGRAKCCVGALLCKYAEGSGQGTAHRPHPSSQELPAAWVSKHTVHTHRAHMQSAHQSSEARRIPRERCANCERALSASARGAACTPLQPEMSSRVTPGSDAATAGSSGPRSQVQCGSRSAVTLGVATRARRSASGCSRYAPERRRVERESKGCAAATAAAARLPKPRPQKLRSSVSSLQLRIRWVRQLGMCCVVWGATWAYESP
jgi:hypothetical protein